MLCARDGEKTHYEADWSEDGDQNETSEKRRMENNGKSEGKGSAEIGKIVNIGIVSGGEGKTYYPAIPANARATSRHLAARIAPATAASTQTAKKAPELNGLDEEDRLGTRRVRKVVRWTVGSLGCMKCDGMREERTAKYKAQGRTPYAAFYSENVLEQDFCMLYPRTLRRLKGVIARCESSCAVKSEECAGESKEEGEKKQRKGVGKKKGRGGQKGREGGVYHRGHGEWSCGGGFEANMDMRVMS